MSRTQRFPPLFLEGLARACAPERPHRRSRGSQWKNPPVARLWEPAGKSAPIPKRKPVADGDWVCEASHGLVKSPDGRCPYGCASRFMRRAQSEDMPWIKPANPDDGGGGTGVPGVGSRLDPNEGVPVIPKPQVDVFEELERSKQAYRAQLAEPIPPQPVDDDPITAISRELTIREQLKNLPRLMDELRKICDDSEPGAKNATAKYLRMRRQNVKRLTQGQRQPLRFRAVRLRVYEFVCDVLCGHLVLELTSPGTDPREQWRRGLPSHQWVRKGSKAHLNPAVGQKWKKT
jgi:hypothetical protein